MSDEPDYDLIDPGIRDVVRYVRWWGLPTSDSGDGASKPAHWYESGEALRVPHVFAMERDVEAGTDDHELIPIWIGKAAVMSRELLGGRPPNPGQEITVSYNAADRTLLFAVYGFTNEDIPKERR